MKLTIVYDNELYRKDIGLKSDWGFACLIESKYDTILFDTGANGKILLDNMRKLDINPSCIKRIVISHEHRDHSGGLKSLAHIVNDIDLYQLGYEILGNNVKTSIPEVPEEISKNLWTTGRIKGLVDEQSLVLKGKKGWYLLTGCSHPGVEKILNVAKQRGNITGLIGGLDGFNNFSILKRLDLICPCHCTQHKREIKDLYPGTYNESGVGKIIKI